MRVRERKNLKVKVRKSKASRIIESGECEPLRVRLRPKELEEVSVFKYFGSLVLVDET